MDITESFRPEDIKTDFFDFVVAPDVTDNSALQQFNRSMKSVGIFLESYNNNNNEDPSTERKETNNNHLVLSNGTPDASTQPPTAYGDPQFWTSSTNCVKEHPRWEGLDTLEDLNNCWNHGGQATNNNTNTSKTDSENTDGAIYTLTVLNGTDQSSTWYRPPDVSEEDTNRSQSTTSTALSTHQNSLDLETFLDSIPSSVSKNIAEVTTYQNGFPSSTAEMTTTTANNAPLASVKSEFAYNDSGYADPKEEMCNQMVTDIVLGSNTTTGQFNNNNDWKMSDNNNERPDGPVVGMDSLLRNALQGKAFLTRYNGSHAIKAEKSEDIRRVLGSPPTAKPSSETSFSTELEEDMKTRSPLMAVSIEGGTVVMFDGGGSTGTMLIDSDNPSSAQSMDDIFLSQLDAVSYPEDYEKLKRIENEVAESVEQYCNLDSTGQSIYIPTHDGGRLPSINHLDHTILSIPSTTTKNTKKYSKRSSSSNKSPHQLQSPSSSSGVRKERSLHYCNICSKGFKDKYSVNVHIRTHTGEKPFACSLCGKSFRQKAHLAKHYHTHLAQAKSAANGSSSKPATGKSR